MIIMDNMKKMHFALTKLNQRIDYQEEMTERMWELLTNDDEYREYLTSIFDSEKKDEYIDVLEYCGIDKCDEMVANACVQWVNSMWDNDRTKMYINWELQTELLTEMKAQRSKMNEYFTA
jgi:hypothetical protein